MERGSPKPLRAELSTTPDVSGGIERTSVHTDVDEVGAAVQTWLRGVLADKEQLAS